MQKSTGETPGKKRSRAPAVWTPMPRGWIAEDESDHFPAAEQVITTAPKVDEDGQVDEDS